MKTAAQRARPASVDVFVGTGEMAERCRAFDWSVTPLGPVSSWPQSLKAVVRLLLASRHPMFLWWGPELVQIYNDAYRPILGEGDRHPRALGMRGPEFWTDVWPIIAPQIECVMTHGDATWHEDELVPIERNGQLEDCYWTYGYSPVYDDEGNVAGTLVVCTENTPRVIAERRQRELLADLEVERSRLASVFEQAPAFIAVVQGPDHVFEIANAGYDQLIGHRDVIGKPVIEALPEVANQGFVELLDSVVATGEAFVGRDLPIMLTRSPGAAPEERFVTFVYQPLTEADGTRSRIFVHGVDVTESVQARRELELRRREAEAANRLKAEFLSTMSHEFRTPLNAILGYAQLLDLEVLGPATALQHAHLERLQASGRHLLQLVDDVLDVAKIDADRMEVHLAVHTVGTVVADALASVQPQATARNIAVADAARASEIRYVGDDHRVRQILVNLLSNAVKFTPPGGRVSITAGLVAEPDPVAQLTALAENGSDGWTFLRVEDTGPGLAPELMGRLFEPFSQGAGGLTRGAGGTGLGLAISRRLARLMGGDVSVRSRPGEGATFTLWLPHGEPVPNETAVSHPSAPPQELRLTPGSSPVIPSPSDHALQQALTEEDYRAIYALGMRLSVAAEEVADRYVAALIADGSFPSVRELPVVQVRNHATPTVGLIATQLMIIGETHGQAPELLGDSAQLQRTFAELHGAQRHRLGWAEPDLERETHFLIAEIGRVLGDNRAASTAVQFAAGVAGHVLTQSARTSLRAFRFAKAATTD